MEKVILIFYITSPSPRALKKMVKCAPKTFFSKLDIENFISHKNGYIYFRHQTHPSLYKGLAPKTIFRRSLEKYNFFFEETVK